MLLRFNIYHIENISNTSEIFPDLVYLICCFQKGNELKFFDVGSFEAVFATLAVFEIGCRNSSSLSL